MAPPYIRRCDAKSRKVDAFAARRIEKHRKSLPIASVEERLVEEVRKNDTLIIVAETGSGKTTQLPQFLFKAGFCREGKVIGVTQPRRVAAVTVAKRVAEECGSDLGQKVGYSIRFDDTTSDSTRIKYMTDGLLLRVVSLRVVDAMVSIVKDPRLVGLRHLEALLDPYLSRYSIIIVDEAHERTIHTDVLLGLLKSVQMARSTSLNHYQNFANKKTKDNMLLEKENGAQCINFRKQDQRRKLPPLKLIIMSASMDAGVFSKYFEGAKAVRVEGRRFPVQILYICLDEPNYLDAAVTTILQIHLGEGPGDVLVFLTGKDEIESTEILVKERLQQLPENSRKLITLPIFSSLPSEKQMRVFAPAPAGFRKVILATNIAETSVTIPGIKFVIDPGFVKARSYDPRTGLESLDVVPISKSQALQRSGRAGREGPGKCYRLYLESKFWEFDESTTPEIKRCNLSNVVLQLKALGVEDIVEFDFIEKPSRSAIVKSLEQLFLLGALTGEYKLSDPVGRQMSQLPLDPIYSKALILASEFNCLEEMLITVAMLSVESIFYVPRERVEEARAAMKFFLSPQGDHLTLINVYRASNEFLEKKNPDLAKEKVDKMLRKWCKQNFMNSRSLLHARDIHSHILRHIEQMGLHVASCGDDTLQFRRCLAASFFLNVALKQRDGTYRDLKGGQVVQIHPSSALFGTKPEVELPREYSCDQDLVLGENKLGSANWHLSC
ncbi:hypothetical protein TIFTF001_023514 [Ficus carica]|uniref:RNA helicase n=1 Tax=Ficus carica TaxID=3494 RepID=A0AA88AWY3_FICCA|nr:hypothetical protein TIFTF001_023514 [Ficus carica]